PVEHAPKLALFSRMRNDCVSRRLVSMQYFQAPHIIKHLTHHSCNSVFPPDSEHKFFRLDFFSTDFFIKTIFSRPKFFYINRPKPIFFLQFFLSGIALLRTKIFYLVARTRDSGTLYG